ncbi:PREDICTED: protein SRC2 homolog [Camelina sativa]|uniref:Protein SRC2 homolog n=1 Tax=Camelina sativa TaxID=90675 RepID=A0ABM0SM30_CAMSA|nr:PREDICTED: protein SRC2 homolog [Camelina sativa]
METKSLQIKVMSAKGLKKVSKMDVFVAVKLSGDPKCSDHREQRTQVARNSGTTPKWSNDFMKFPIDQTLAEANRLVITFKIKREQRGSGEKDIGEVHVPVKELLDHLGNDKTGERYVTYQIGKSKGDISFTYSFTDQVAITSGGGCSRYLAPEPVRPAATHQPVLNRPVLSQLLPSVGSFSYDHVPCQSQSQPPFYPPQAQPEILPPAFFPGLYQPHGYQMSYIPESPPTMYTSIFPGLSCPPQTQPGGLYPPTSPYRF